MIERIIQTLKMRLAAINIDDKWSKETLDAKISTIIQNIKLILITKITTTHYESAQQKTSNIVTKPATKISHLPAKNISI